MQHSKPTRRLVAVNVVCKKHMQIKVKLHKQKSDIINSKLFEISAKLPTIAKCAGKTWKWRSLSSTPTYSVHNVTCVTVLWWLLFDSMSHSFAAIELNILLTRRSRLYLRFKKRMHGHSFKALNRWADVSAADWLSQTHMKSYLNFSRFSHWWKSL